jgi:hypothetical protein
MATYDKSVGPKEGKSAISGTTRKRIFGGKKGVGSFNEWLNQGGAGGPVNTGQQAQPNEFSGDVRMTLDNQQQLLANMFNPQGQQAPTWTGGGQPQGGDQMANLKMWIDWMREKQAADLQRPGIAFNAAAQASDPVRYAQEQYTARQASDPWGPGGQFADRPRLTPEAAIASQGNNAVNQWAQQGGITQGGQQIDPAELRRLNQIAAAGRGYRSYF